MAEWFKPTQRMASAARRGLRLREPFGRGGTAVGVARARQLADQRDLGAADMRSMHSFLVRHPIQAWDSNSDPSAGFIGWLLGGGDRKAKALD